MKTESEYLVEEELKRIKRQRSFCNYIYILTGFFIMTAILLLLIAGIIRKVNHDTYTIIASDMYIETDTLPTDDYTIEDKNLFLRDGEEYHTIEIAGYTVDVNKEQYETYFAGKNSINTDIYLASCKTTASWAMDFFAKKQLVYIRLSIMGDSAFSADDYAYLSELSADTMNSYKYSYLHHSNGYYPPLMCAQK